MLYTFPVDEAHSFVGTEMLPGVAGIAVGVSEPVDLDALLPQAPLLAVTETVPAPVPMVIVAEVVP